MEIKRVILIIIDGCGVGELPDAKKYNDVGASTLSNCSEVVGGLKMPVCQSLGLGNIVPIKGLPPTKTPRACFGKMNEQSEGKDSTIGHWEIAGLVTDKPFPTYPNGFPIEIVKQFKKAASVKTIGNCVASGTEIIERLGEQHIRTKEIILYTSADSVFQLAAHEDVYSTDELYKICQIARELLTGKHAVARVIARPFKGDVGDFKRTTGRKDFSLPPHSKTVLNYLADENLHTLAIGKINDLFAGNGIATHIKTKSNLEGLTNLKEKIMHDNEHALIFANLVEFDELWGHRRNPQGFATALEEFDVHLGETISELHNNDLLIVTADHGCDPTYEKHTDHTREYVPLLVYNRQIQNKINLGTRNSFTDIAKTIADLFDIDNNLSGTSFKNEITQ